MSNDLRAAARLRGWALAIAAVAGAAGGPAVAQFVPNETQVSTNPGLIDFQFSASRGKFAWTDPAGNLWVADVDRATGAFVPAHGRGTRVATSTVSGGNMYLWTGPEWITNAGGDQLVYNYYRPGTPPHAHNTSMATAVLDRSGAWVLNTLSPELARMALVTSQDAGDVNPRILYLDPALNHYWRNVKDPASETLLPFLPPDTRAWRFVSGMRAIVYAAVATDGVQQVFRYMLDSGTHAQLTFDAGDKDAGRTVPWMWRAPELGGDYVLSTFVGNELRLYRQRPTAAGPKWLPFHRATLPAGSTVSSPKWFAYDGRSYVVMAVHVGGASYPSQVWLSGIDPAAPLLRRISDDTLHRARHDPEVFVTDGGPYVYYNRYDPSLDPDHPMCAACSEGVFRADAGLRPR